MLAQVNEEDPRLYHPKYFGSKALTESERKISTYEKEFLAIVYFIHFFKLCLTGKKFIVYTDQKSLQFLIKFNEDASAKLVRWQVSLLAYDFDIIYKAGTMNVRADAMSRLPAAISQGPPLEAISADYYLPLNVVRKEPEDGFDQAGPQLAKKEKTELIAIKEKQLVGSTGMGDELYRAFVGYITEWRYPEKFTERQRRGIHYESRKYQVENGILYKRPTRDYTTRRKVAKPADILRVLQENHDHIFAGHQGINNTFKKVSEKYYWPGYYETVRVYVQTCKICRRISPKAPGIPLQPVEQNLQGAFAKIGIDFIYTPRTEQGHSAALLVIIDYLTSWVHAEPVYSQSAATTCVSLFKWICQYGCPRQIIADNGPHFSALELKE